MKIFLTLTVVVLFAEILRPVAAGEGQFEVTEDDEQIKIVTPNVEASIRKKGYVSGVYRGTFLDKKTGFRDAGFGLDIVDWIMEPGSDEAYRDKLDGELVYRFNNPYHGKRAKRSIEGPQICTQARELSPKVICAEEFVAAQMSFHYKTAAPDKKTGSKWTQTIVFPAGKRYFISSDRIDSVNSSDAMFLRIDMPGHIRHDRGSTFSEIYLSYKTNKFVPDAIGKPGTFRITREGEGQRISSNAFFNNFAPDVAFNYRRDEATRRKSIPKRFIRAYRLRDPETGKQGPWLAGMTLDPTIVYDAWCHQRGYVCMIEEFGGRPVKAGESFSAAFIVGYFDSIEEMHKVYDKYAGNSGLSVTSSGWRLTKK